MTGDWAAIADDPSDRERRAAHGGSLDLLAFRMSAAARNFDWQERSARRPSLERDPLYNNNMQPFTAPSHWLEKEFFCEPKRCSITILYFGAAPRRITERALPS